jgi:hypothetical protein
MANNKVQWIYLLKKEICSLFSLSEESDTTLQNSVSDALQRDWSRICQDINLAMQELDKDIRRER